MSIKWNYLVIAVIFQAAFELALAVCMILPRFVQRNCGQHHWHSNKRNRESAKAGVRKKSVRGGKAVRSRAAGEKDQR